MADGPPSAGGDLVPRVNDRDMRAHLRTATSYQCPTSFRTLEDRLCAYPVVIVIGGIGPQYRSCPPDLGFAQASFGASKLRIRSASIHGRVHTHSPFVCHRSLLISVGLPWPRLAPAPRKVVVVWGLTATVVGSATGFMRGNPMFQRPQETADSLFRVPKGLRLLGDVPRLPGHGRPACGRSGSDSSRPSWS